MKRAQTWSTDTVAGVVIFVFVITIVFYFIGGQQRSQNFEEIKSESNALPGVLSSQNQENLSFVENSKVSKERLASFANLSYEEVKQKLGMKYDFCIYLEDEEGKIVNITYGRPGVGSPSAVLAGAACGLSSQQIFICRNAEATRACASLSENDRGNCCKYLGSCCG